MPNCLTSYLIFVASPALYSRGFVNVDDLLSVVQKEVNASLGIKKVGFSSHPHAKQNLQDCCLKGCDGGCGGRGDASSKESVTLIVSLRKGVCVKKSVA